MPGISQHMQVVQQLSRYTRGQQGPNQLEHEELPKFRRAVSDLAWKRAQPMCCQAPSRHTHTILISSYCPHPLSSTTPAPSHPQLSSTKKCLVCAPETTGCSPNAVLYLQFVSMQLPLIYLQWFVRHLCFHMKKKKVNKPTNFTFFRLTLCIFLWHPKQAHLLNIKSQILSFP